MVRAGLAVRDRDEPRDLAEEAEARAARRGLRAGDLINPYHWGAALSSLLDDPTDVTSRSKFQ